METVLVDDAGMGCGMGCGMVDWIVAIPAVKIFAVGVKKFSTFDGV